MPFEDGLLSEGLKREAERVVRDRKEDKRIRATALLLLVGPVNQLPNLVLGAARVDLGDQYDELSSEFSEIIDRNEDGVWVPKASSQEQCVKRLEERIKQTATIWLIHGGGSQIWLEIGKFIEHDLKLRYVEFSDLTSKRFFVAERVQTMVGASELAIAVMSSEDKTAEGKMRARQNVIHEIGLAQGVLGWDRVLLLREKGIEDFTNMAGLVYVSYNREDLQACFSELRSQIDLRLF